MQKDYIDVNLSDLTANSGLYRIASKDSQKLFDNAVITYTTLINSYVNKYKNKHSIKGEFIADVLQDMWWDLIYAGVNNLDYELREQYDGDIDKFSENLIEQSLDAKRWIKVLKKVYRENKQAIVKDATDENGKIDLDLINSNSAEYRDYLYE